MTDVTVRQFATVVGIPVDRLLEQFTEAGITVAGADAAITEKQKLDLLAHLRKSHGDRPAQGAAEPRKITLKRKTHSEIKMTGGAAGQVKTVSIEVRKKRTYVKRSLVEDEASRHREPEVQAAAPVPIAMEASEPHRPLEPAEEVRRVLEETEPRQAEEATRPPVAEETVLRAPDTDEVAGRQIPEEAPPPRLEAVEAEDRQQPEEVMAHHAPEEAPRRRTEAPPPEEEQRVGRPSQGRAADWKRRTHAAGRRIGQQFPEPPRPGRANRPRPDRRPTRSSGVPRRAEPGQRPGSSRSPGRRWTPEPGGVLRAPRPSGAAKPKRPGAGRARARRIVCRARGVVIRPFLIDPIAAGPGKPRAPKSPRRRSGMVSPNPPHR